MRRMVPGICGLLALFAIPGFAAPATACRYSRPVFTAEPVRTYGSGQVRVRVDEALMIGSRLTAVRATALADWGRTRRGRRIVIIVPPDDTANCYYGGLADPAAVTGDGALQGYAILRMRPEPSGAFSSWLATDADRTRYAAFAQGRLRGRWMRPRFTANGEPAE